MARRASSQFSAWATWGVDAFDLVGELVVEEFVEEDLGDDFELVAIVAEAVAGADGLEIVDEGGGFFL